MIGSMGRYAMPDAYVLDADDFEKLKTINRRLYDDRPLNGDQRRDLANLMQAIIWRAIELK